MARTSNSIFATVTGAILIAGGVLSFAAHPIVEMPTPQRNAPYGVGARPALNNGAGSQSGNAPMETILAWNTVTNEVEVESGSMVNRFNFVMTNISKAPVTLTAVGTSCGCTAAKLPDLPKTLQPKDILGFEVDMNISGKHGIVEKTVTLSTDKGDQKLFVISNIKPVMTGMDDADRRQNLEMAIADRQAIFIGDCARCHVEPTRNKTGKELFTAACGICHEAEHRATMVPDLHNLPVETSAAFWSTWITYGKPNTLMPAFSQSQGGSLTSDQITSLVDYLVTAIPSKAPAAAKAN